MNGRIWDQVRVRVRRGGGDGGMSYGYIILIPFYPITSRPSDLTNPFQS